MSVKHHVLVLVAVMALQSGAPLRQADSMTGLIVGQVGRRQRGSRHHREASARQSGDGGSSRSRCTAKRSSTRSSSCERAPTMECSR